MKLNYRRVTLLSIPYFASLLLIFVFGLSVASLGASRSPKCTVDIAAANGSACTVAKATVRPFQTERKPLHGEKLLGCGRWRTWPLGTNCSRRCSEHLHRLFIRRTLCGETTFRYRSRRRESNCAITQARSLRS